MAGISFVLCIVELHDLRWKKYTHTKVNEMRLRASEEDKGRKTKALNVYFLVPKLAKGWLKS